MGSPAAEQTAAEDKLPKSLNVLDGSGRTMWSLIHPEGFLGHGSLCHHPPTHPPTPPYSGISESSVELWIQAKGWQLDPVPGCHRPPVSHRNRTGSYLGVLFFPYPFLQQSSTGQPWPGYSWTHPATLPLSVSALSLTDQITICPDPPSSSLAQARLSGSLLLVVFAEVLGAGILVCNVCILRLHPQLGTHV